MNGRDIVAVGASTGGVEALSRLVSYLPEDLPAAIFVVLHLPGDAESHLPLILGRAGPLPAGHPEDGEKVERGRIYVAPPDRHLLVEDGRVRLSRGPKENRYRPAVDPLFRSVALAYGPRSVGVILSGALDDGTAGLGAISRLGGLTVVQEPEEALAPGMPRSALENVKVDHRLPLAEIGGLIARATEEPVEATGGEPMPDEIHAEHDFARGGQVSQEDLDRLGELSSLTCPECGGPLWELGDGEPARYRCRVGHAFSLQSMLADQSDKIEETLYAALNALEERAELHERLARQSRAQGRAKSAGHFDAEATEAREHGDRIRGILEASRKEKEGAES